MSTPSPAILRVLVALSAAGSLLPGTGVGPGPAESPPPRGTPAATQKVAITADPSSLRRTWSWPLDPRPAVLAPFVAPRSTYGAGHRGIDLAATQGQQVRAVDAGVVTHVGVIAGRGTVSITHASGLRSTYEPVKGVLGAGSTVAVGQVVGVVEGRSHCGGSCLHLGALSGRAYLDPRPLLGGGRVILLPLAGGP